MKLRKFILLFSSLFSSLLSVGNSVVPVCASDDFNYIDFSEPLEDLLESENFKNDYLLGKYKDTTGGCKLLSFSEYQYDTSFTNNFAFYLYVFNPKSELNLDYTSFKNKISFSTKDKDGKVTSNLQKYDISFISKTSSGEYNNKFYKFKVDCDYSKIYSKLSKEKRIYEISEIELRFTNNVNATAYEVGNSFIYSGYSVGCNNQDTSTLKLETDGLKYVEIQCKGGYYRSGFTDESLETAKDLLYVTFKLPNELFEIYESLYSIEYEYYHYNITGLTHDSSVGVGGFDGDHEITWYEWIFLTYYFNLVYYDENEVRYTCNADNYDISYNEFIKQTGLREYVLDNPLDEISPSYFMNLYKKEGMSLINPNWNNLSEKQKKNFINKHKVHKTKNVNELTLPSGEPYVSNTWDKFLTFLGFNSSISTHTEKFGELSPIVVVDSYENNNGEKWKINKEDITQFNKDYEDCLIHDKKLILFRYDVVNYHKGDFYIQKAPHLGGVNNLPATYLEGYSFMTSFIDDFDIIQFGFMTHEGNVELLPVVCSPISYFLGTTPPETLPKIDWEKIIRIILSVLLILFLIWLIFKLLNLRKSHLENKANKQIIKEHKAKQKREKKARKRKD